MTHIPVLLNETLQYLDPKPGDDFIDCTVGEGGHALAILKLTGPNGRVLGIDRDADTGARLKEQAGRMGVSDRILLHHGNFAQVGEIAQSHNFGRAQGIVFDFGLSSWQLEESGAGFSFQNIEPLDMRYDRTRDSATASTILNSWPEDAIFRVISEFGEERYARRIAKGIIIARRKQKIETTDQLVRVILQAIPMQYQKSNTRPAARTFQALRIAVNSELENIEEGLKEAINLLFPRGRIVAISFHSLEDRRVKNIFREKMKEGLLRILTKKPIQPSGEEVRANPRARSAKLRGAEKI